MTGMVTVSQEEFFAYVGPRDIVPINTNPEYTVWETRYRHEVGRTWPGWRNPGDPEVYMLTESAVAEMKAASVKAA